MKFKSFHDMLKTNAKQFENSAAFIFDVNGVKREVSYKSFYSACMRKKRFFLKRECSCVGILSATSYSQLVNLFGAVMAGKQTVLLEPSLKDETLQLLISYTDVDYLFCEKPESRSFKLKNAPAVDNPAAADNGEGKILFFTSGTTSLSKAVVLTSKSLCASAWNGQQKLVCAPDDNVISLLPLTHVFGFVCSMLWPLAHGASVSLGRGMRFLAQDCKYFRPSILSAVPSMLKFLIGMNLLNDNLKTVLVGAGPADEATLDAAKKIGLNVSFGYGLTETSSGVAISVGGNPFAMDVCPDNTVTLSSENEIFIACRDCMMLGYYKNQAATDAVLIDGVFHSGDLGRFDENGKLYITGRKKDVIALENGTKIYIPDCEAELAVFLKADEFAVFQKGMRAAVCCYFKAGAPDKNTLENILSDFNDTQPFDKQIARIFISASPLPKTATGKIQRWQLEKLFKDA